MNEPTNTNDWCRTLGIAPPNVDAVADHREANTFALLLVALLEHGGPLTLADVAARFEVAGIAERSRALLSLQRCKPGRPPVFRTGDLYHLDPHDEDLFHWVVRLGLRPPPVAQTPPRVVEAAPLPGPDTSLSIRELDEAWNGESLRGWSAQRLVVAVLDAHGEPLAPSEVVAAVETRTQRHALKTNAAKFKRRNSAVAVLEDGHWAIAADAAAIVQQTRIAVRDRIALVRRRAGTRMAPEVLAQRVAEWEAERAAEGARLANLSRGLLVGFPPARPAAVALLDVGEHKLSTFVGNELSRLPSHLAKFDILGGIDVRVLLRGLGFHPGARKLAELGPPQKTRKLNQQGRTLKITTALLVQGSCGISKPFGDAKKLADYLGKGDETKLRRRLEADVKSLYALYEYGRLHGAVRLRWGFLDELITAPWVHHNEQTLYGLKRSALAMNVPLEVVVGSAPGWTDPWSRGRFAHVVQDANGRGTQLIGTDGYLINEYDVQRARLPAAMR